jgi:hypothetical protein
MVFGEALAVGVGVGLLSKPADPTALSSEYSFHYLLK